MLPSRGRPGTGESSAVADTNSLSRSSSSTAPPRQPTSQFASRIDPPTWFLSSSNSTGPSTGPHDIPVPPSTSNAPSSSYMIGPTSTFYDPEVFAQQQQQANNAQYQQWVATFSGQQQQQHASHQPQAADSYQVSHQQVYPQHRLQTQYNPAQLPYTTSQYLNSGAAMTTHSNMSGTGTSLNDDTSYLQVPTNSPHAGYYSQPGTGPHTPDLSYSATPDSLYQQPQFQRVPHEQPQTQTHYAASSSYTSELSAHLQPNPRSTSSASPASNVWTEEVRTSSAHSNVSAKLSTTSSLSNAIDPNHGRGTSKQSTSSPKPPTVFTKPTKGARQSQGRSHPSPSPSHRSGPAERTSKKRKRLKKTERETETQLYQFEGGSDSDSDEEGAGINISMTGGISVGMGGLGVATSGGKMGRMPGACKHCKKLKMKCDFPRGENTCKRCRTGGHICIVEGRKPRSAPNKREYLLAQIRQKDSIIESLLKQLHNPYIATPMSIASYKMATSPSDSKNKNTLDWLDQLETSVRMAGRHVGPRAFKDIRTGATGIDEEDSGEEESHAKRFGLVPPPDDDDQTVGDDGERTTQADDKLSSLPDHVPLGLIANLSLSGNKGKKVRKESKDIAGAEESLDDDDVGVANETYFMPGPATDLGMRAMLIEQHSPPEILVHGLVVPEDVEKLFEIFYEHINPFVSLLDPTLHTPASTFARCPFLFTVVCAISSRYYTEKSQIYPIAMHFAKHAAANALIDGWKSVELCQAYILMSVYAVPARRWEEDRSWLYTGLAIRIATDLNLHQVSSIKPQNEKQEREILNKTRVWMICFNLDRSTATQFGKPSTIKEDYIMRNATDWYKKSQYNLSYDVHLCAYSALLRIVAKSHDEIFSDPSSPTGLNKRVDFRSVTMNHDAQLTSYHEEWTKRFKETSDTNDPGCAFRCRLLPFLVEYSRLVMFSFGFQQAYHRGIEPGDHVYFTKCLDAAKAVIRNMVEGLAPTGYMRYAPDGHFIFASFASAFLLKLLRPEFANLLSKDQESDIFGLIGRLIQTLSSPEIAIDDRHTPKLYARFLAALLSRHRREGTIHVGRSHSNPPPPSHSAPSASIHVTSSAATSSPSTFQPSQSQGASGQGHGYSSDSYTLNQGMDTTPIYALEGTFSEDTSQVNFGSDLGISPFGNGGMSDEEMLATMQALKNPAWWQNMMMPGFSWPESQSPSSNGNSPSAYPNGYASPNQQFGSSFSMGMDTFREQPMVMSY